MRWGVLLVLLTGGFFMFSAPRALFSRILLGTTTSAAQSTAAMTGYSVAYVTVPNEETGKKIARGLVEGKLAACVNIVPKVTSIYEWQGKIEEDTELMLIIKTRANRMDDVSAFVRNHHPAEVPEVIAMPIENGNSAYLEWLGNIVQSKKND